MSQSCFVIYYKIFYHNCSLLFVSEYFVTNFHGNQNYFKTFYCNIIFKIFFHRCNDKQIYCKTFYHNLFSIFHSINFIFSLSHFVIRLRIFDHSVINLLFVSEYFIASRCIPEDFITVFFAIFFRIFYTIIFCYLSHNIFLQYYFVIYFNKFHHQIYFRTFSHCIILCFRIFMATRLIAKYFIPSCFVIYSKIL